MANFRINSHKDKKCNVVLLDDNIAILKLGQRVFQTELPEINLLVYQSADEEFYKDMSSCCVDLFVIDIKLNDDDGINVAKKLCQLCPGTIILFISGFDYDCSVCTEIDCLCEFINKPLNINLFINRIKILLHISACVTDNIQEIRYYWQEVLDRDRQMIKEMETDVFCLKD